MKNRNIKAVLFDLGGVIIEVDYRKTIEAFTELGIKDANLIYNQFDQGPIFDEYEIGGISSDTFIKSIQHKTNTPMTSIEITGAWNAMIGSYPIDKLDYIMM